MHSFHILIFLDSVSRLEKCNELSKKKKIWLKNSKLNPLAVLFKEKRKKFSATFHQTPANSWFSLCLITPVLPQIHLWPW